MPDKYKLIAGVATLVIGQQLVIRSLQLKYAEIARAAIEIDKHNDVLLGQVTYLLSVIEENDIELDEFDLTVLTNNLFTRD
jgi:hypothetical protein